MIDSQIQELEKLVRAEDAREVCSFAVLAYPVYRTSHVEARSLVFHSDAINARYNTFRY